MATEIKMPLAAEGLEKVTILEVKVKPGDTVSAGESLLELEAEKSTVELPAPAAGRISKVLVKKGDVVQVGQVLFLFEESETAPAAAAQVEPAAPAKARKVEPPPAAAETAEPPHAPTPAQPESVAAVPTDAARTPLAGPATRRLARELGVDLTLVPGKGRHGRVNPEDVKAYVRDLNAGTALPVAVPAGGPAQAKLPDFAKWGPVERQPLSLVRRLTAQQTSLSWSVIPHVTQHDLADITELDAFRRQQQGGPKLTVTAFAVKAAAIALKEYPQVNSSLDQSAGQLVLKHYYHIGVAVDTERGLLVPVLRDVDRKSVLELARELAEVAEQARQGKADMHGGTFTITNLGGIGGTAFTPIVNYPEVAILGLARSRMEAVVKDGQVTLRLMLPLSLSYDHRVVDGALGARFLRRLASLLEKPLQMLLHA
jgi:pyruvate dehydrogenase E2 component (dihydrolipoamide acetyltransferase)